jgi:hypothetical protein
LEKNREEGRGRKEEGGRKREEGRGRKEEGRDEVIVRTNQSRRTQVQQAFYSFFVLHSSFFCDS